MPNCPYDATAIASLRIVPEASARAVMAGRYVDNALSSEEQGEFQQHLSACPACRAEVDRLSAIRSALQTLPMPTASEQFIARLQAQWENVSQLSVLRIVNRLTKIAAVVAVVAMGHLAYEALAGHTAQTAQAAAPAAWEQVVIAPDSPRAPTNEEPSVASSAPQFAEFVVQDLSRPGEGRGGRP